jgi:NTE family protein
MDIRADDAPMPEAEAAAPVKTINLALQGGGAHGAFSWGVLDRLLEDERIGFEGISATSAGAANATVLCYGLTVGGRDGAKQALRDFWQSIARAAVLSPLKPMPWDRLANNHSLEHSPVYLALDLMSRMFSPYQLNPLNIDPLKMVLLEVVDFERLQHGHAVKLFLTATNVRTCKVKVFTGKEITVEAVLASACLPFIHQAVEIDGEHYWDGGYMGNPAIFPLIYDCDSTDVVIVHINPTERPEVPTTARDIMNRINEISFNSSLMREMRAISFITQLIEDGKLKGTAMKRMLIHSIDADDVMRALGAASKLNADWDFLLHLHDIGRKTADSWLDENFRRLGKESSVDIRAKYL